MQLLDCINYSARMKIRADAAVAEFMDEAGEYASFGQFYTNIENMARDLYGRGFRDGAVGAKGNANEGH